LIGKKIRYFKISYEGGDYFIVKELPNHKWIIIYSIVDEIFHNLQVQHYLYDPLNYGVKREEISEAEAQMEIMLG